MNTPSPTFGHEFVTSLIKWVCILAALLFLNPAVETIALVVNAVTHTIGA